uniref:G-protein coupled receptors family 2 profile 2 domain-containing protein n=1 Tax=Zonotrichia albicollis TaxID=44394 RepID=A0A8D2QCG5_ZONAL
MVLCFQELRNAGSPRACAVCATKCPGQVSTGASLLGAPVNSLSVPPVQCTEHSNTPNRFVYLELFSIWKYFIVTLSCLNGGVGDLGGTSWDCVLQGALSTFANTSSFFWTMAIALYLYLSIVRGSPAGQGLLWGFHAVSWGVPLAITVAAVALRKIGYDASNVSVGWCWVNLDAEDRLLWMLLAGKLWEILAYVTLPVLYLLIRKHINRAVSISPQERWEPQPGSALLLDWDRTGIILWCCWMAPLDAEPPPWCLFGGCHHCGMLIHHCGLGMLIPLPGVWGCHHWGFGDVNSTLGFWGC